MKLRLIILFFILSSGNVLPDFWVPLNGPYMSGGIIDAIACSEDMILAANRGQGVFQSTDAGENWIKINSGISADSLISGFAFGAGGEALMYTDYSLFELDTALGHWEKISLQEIDGINGLYVSSSGAVYIFGTETLYKANSDFSNIDSLANIQVHLMAEDNSSNIFFCSSEKIYSMDNENQYTLINSSMESEKSIQNLFFGGDTIIIAKNRDGFFTNDRESSDWPLLTNEKKDADIIFSFGQMYAFTLDGGLYLSNDYGLYWIEIEVNLSLTISAEEDRQFGICTSGIFIGTGGKGVLKSDLNIAEWTFMNSGFDTYPVIALASDRNNYIYAGISGQLKNGKVFILKNFGESWQETAFSKPVSRLFTNSHDEVFVFSDTDVFKSVDAGENWESLNIGSVNDFTIDKNDYMFMANESELKYSNDNGNSWIKILDLPAYNDCKILSAGYEIWFLALSDSSDNEDNPIVTNFIKFDLNGIITENISGLNRLPTDIYSSWGNYLFMSTPDQGILRSHNGGENWSRYNSGLDNLTVNKLNGFEFENDTIYVATAAGVYYIPSSGDKWFLTDASVDMYCYDFCLDSDDYLYTASGQVYRSAWRISETVTIVEQNSCSDSDIIVFPNPSKDFIHITSPALAEAEVNMYDYTGRIVPVDYSPGNKELILDVNHLSPGCYIIKLMVSGSVEYFPIVVQ